MVQTCAQHRILAGADGVFRTPAGAVVAVDEDSLFRRACEEFWLRGDGVQEPLKVQHPVVADVVTFVDLIAELDRADFSRIDLYLNRLPPEDVRTPRCVVVVGSILVGGSKHLVD